jgi:hypothetical protein
MALMAHSTSRMATARKAATAAARAAVPRPAFRNVAARAETAVAEPATTEFIDANGHLTPAGQVNLNARCAIRWIGVQHELLCPNQGRRRMAAGRGGRAASAQGPGTSNPHPERPASWRHSRSSPQRVIHAGMI